MNSDTQLEHIIANAEELVTKNPRSLGYITAAETNRIVTNMQKFWCMAGVKSR